MNKYEKLSQKHSQDNYIVGGVVAVLVLVGAFAVWMTSRQSPAVPPSGVSGAASSSASGAGTSTASSAGTSTPAALALAQCLKAKQVTMYGAAWCSHCQDQKKEFGAAFESVPYVECPDNVKLCLSKGVQGYPTWVGPDGQKLEGVRTFDELAKFAGCQLPEAPSR